MQCLAGSQHIQLMKMKALSKLYTENTSGFSFILNFVAKSGELMHQLLYIYINVYIYVIFIFLTHEQIIISALQCICLEYLEVKMLNLLHN